MPILEISIVVGDDEAMTTDLPRRLADAAADVFGAAAGTVWVRLQRIAAADYAENGTAAADTPRPAWVRVLQATPAEGERRAVEALALAHALAPLLARPAERIHLIYEPPAAGRVAFGGRLRGG